MQGLAVTAIVVLAVAIFGGPATYLMAGAKPRTPILFWLHRTIVTLLGIGAILMGVTLTLAHISVIFRILGGVGAVIAIAGLYRLYKGRRKSWR